MVVIENKTCLVEGCKEPIKAKCRCRKHYNKWLTTRPDGKPCSVVGCTSPRLVKGMCQSHYSRMLYEKKRGQKCLVDACNKPLSAMGFCVKHRSENRQLPKSIERQAILPEGMGMSIEMENVKDVLTSGDVAKICNVATRTVAKWIDNGTLEGYKIPNSRDRRVTKLSLIDFLKKNNMPMYVAAKRNVMLYGFPEDTAEIIKKLTEDDLGVRAHAVNDSFAAGLFMGERKPSLVIVDGCESDEIMPMLKALDISTAEVVVVTDDMDKMKGLNVNILKSPYRVKDIIEAIIQYI